MEHTHEYDMKAIHYQPAGRSPVCGASARVVDRVQAGQVTNRHEVLKVKSSTDVRKISCVHCRKWLKGITDQFKEC